ncbi:hypothetical protein [Leptothermofonsia sp. ETS-13]|uniref:hypothetical protein n=1 Tax=Leptothermofonsia sp. ETS-13 TaxID=3035696 RepID=UPI003B9E196D
MPETNYRNFELGFGRWVAIAPLLGSLLAVLTEFCHLLAQAQSPPNLENITIGPRFSPNSLQVRGSGGGNVPVKDIVGISETPTGSCTGFANAKPNHTLVLTSFFNSLSLQVESPEDTAIAIKGPGGVWCNDDYQGKNPGVSGQWLAGTYQVWVSSYGKNRFPTYILRITEVR